MLSSESGLTRTSADIPCLVAFAASVCFDQTRWSRKPQWARIIVLLTARYLHLGPFSRHVIAQIEQQFDGSQDIDQVLNAPVEPADNVYQCLIPAPL